MKIAKKLLTILVLSVLCVFAFAGCGNSGVRGRLKDRGVDTKLWNDYQIVCDVKGETFAGRASCYAVVEFKSEPTDFLQSFETEKSEGFCPMQNDEIEAQFDAWLVALKIESKYYPDWDDEYLFLAYGGVDGELERLYSDSLYMIYFPNSFRLMILETGH